MALTSHQGGAVKVGEANRTLRKARVNHHKPRLACSRTEIIRRLFDLLLFGDGGIMRDRLEADSLAVCVCVCPPAPAVRIKDLNSSGQSLKAIFFTCFSHNSICTGCTEEQMTLLPGKAAIFPTSCRAIFYLVSIAFVDLSWIHAAQPVLRR